MRRDEHRPLGRYRLWAVRLTGGIAVVGAALVVGASASSALTLPDYDDVPPSEEQTSVPVTVPADAQWDFATASVYSQSAAQIEQERYQAWVAEQQALGLWGWQVPSSGRLTSFYGHRDPITLPNGATTGDFHNGIDFAAPYGTPIMAAFDGTVVSVSSSGNRELGLSGAVLVIEHEVPGYGQVLTSYNHMSADQIAVSEGDVVLAGQTVAYTGNTGNSTGPHLHFSVWVDGQSVDPIPWLAERGIDLG